MMINFNVVKQMLRKNRVKRPILGCVNYTKTHIEYTDSYSAVRIEADNDVEFALNVFTGKLQGGEYPKLDRLMGVREVMEDVRGVELELKGGDLNYKLNEHYFDKKAVDVVFKTVGLDIMNEAKHLMVKKETPFLNYKHGGVEIIVLGNKYE